MKFRLPGFIPFLFLVDMDYQLHQQNIEYCVFLLINIRLVELQYFHLWNRY